jgi:hypothetical protein
VIVAVAEVPAAGGVCDKATEFALEFKLGPITTVMGRIHISSNENGSARLP